MSSHYPSVPIDQQVVFLAGLFSELSPISTLRWIRDTLSALLLPPNAEGWFAVPRWQRLADSYEKALERLFYSLEAQRPPFDNPLKNGIEAICPRQPQVDALESVWREQKGDILVIPAQFGTLHRGISTIDAQNQTENQEFLLGTFAAGCMLLTNPERLNGNQSAWLYCSGNGFGVGSYFVLAFGMSEGETLLRAQDATRPSDYSSHPSGFLLKAALQKAA